MTKEVFTTKEAAEYLGISQAALRILTNKKRISCYKVKGGIRNYYTLEMLKDYALGTYVPSDAEVASKAEARSLQ